MYHVSLMRRFFIKQILNHTLTIERKGNVTLMMRPTIPFVSETIHFPDGKEIAAPLNIQLSFPGNSEAKCKQSSSGSLQKCSVTIDSYTYSDSQKYDDETNWYRIHTIELFNSDVEGYYMADHKLVLRLETNNANGQGSKIFSNVVFHNVHVRLTKLFGLMLVSACNSVSFNINPFFLCLDKCCR